MAIVISNANLAQSLAHECSKETRDEGLVLKEDKDLCRTSYDKAIESQQDGVLEREYQPIQPWQITT